MSLSLIMLLAASSCLAESMAEDIVGALSDVAAEKETRNCDVSVTYDGNESKAAARLISALSSRLERPMVIATALAGTNLLLPLGPQKRCGLYIILGGQEFISEAAREAKERKLDRTTNYFVTVPSNGNATAVPTDVRNLAVAVLDTSSSSTVEISLNCMWCRREAGGIRVPRKTWFKKSGLLPRDRPTMVFGNSDLAGHEFVVVTPDNQLPIVYRMETKEGQSIFGGAEIRLLKALSEYVGFKYRLVEAWSPWGVLEELLAKKVDFGLGPNAYHPGKNPMADFTHWYGFDHYVFAYHRPTPLPKYMALVRPFEPEVFAAVAGALAVNTAVLWIFARLSGADRDFRAFARDAMESFGALTMQGFYFWPKTWPLKLSLLFWCLAAAILGHVYSDSLISHLARPGLAEVPRDFHQLLEMDDYPTLINHGEYKGFTKHNISLFMAGKLGKKILAKLVKQGMEQSTYDGARKLFEEMKKHPRAGFLWVRNVVQMYMDLQVTTNLGDRSVGRINPNPSHFLVYGLPHKKDVLNKMLFRKDSGLGQFLDGKLLAVFESGLYSHWLRWCPHHYKEHRKEVGLSPWENDGVEEYLDKLDRELGLEVFSLDHFQGSFIVLAAGFALSATALAYEFAADKRDQEEEKDDENHGTSG